MARWKVYIPLDSILGWLAGQWETTYWATFPQCEFSQYLVTSHFHLYMGQRKGNSENNNSLGQIIILQVLSISKLGIPMKGILSVCIHQFVLHYSSGAMLREHRWKSTQTLCDNLHCFSYTFVSWQINTYTQP